ncbi:MAG: sulfatase-like hydrolase/transferase [Myxococcota bacterium]
MNGRCVAIRYPRASAGNRISSIEDDYGVDSSSLYAIPSVDDAFSTQPNQEAPPTPNLEALARAGIVFDNAWSNPSCSPTRATMLTGRYGFRTGVQAVVSSFTPAENQLSVSEFTLPEALDSRPDLGYAHANIGKWHLTTASPEDPNIAGWQRFSGSLTGFEGFTGVPPDQVPPGAPEDTYFDWIKTIDGVSTEGYSVYATSDHTRDAVRFIREQDRDDNPWVVWLAYTAPHDPFHLPPARLHDYNALSGEPEDIEANPRLYYEAMVQALDTSIGNLLNNIDLAETTVIFVGDNGTLPAVVLPPFDPQRAKGTLSEGGVKVPMVIAGAGVNSPGRRVAGLVNLVDVFATTLELVGIDSADVVPEGVAIDSVSMVPLLAGEAQNTRDWIFTEQAIPESLQDSTFQIEEGESIRDERYKLDVLASGERRFFDLWSDPYERANLLQNALQPEEQEALERLELKLQQLRE